jgi:hypothetical protein
MPKPSRSASSSRQRSVRSVLLSVLAATGCLERQEEPAEPGSTGEADGSEGDSSSTATADADASTDGTGARQGSSDEGSSGPAGPEYACADESECLLHSDCCGCTAVHVDEPIAACDMSCDRNACESWGITGLLCAHTCHIRLVECDAAMVTCDQAPPACDDGFSPSVDERCWSGYCIPTDLCRP